MERRLEFAKRYDLVVVGGGIHGAATAWEAAVRGLSVVLLEQNDFASGASANSLKIIHGGLRYLQTLDLRRARESASEQLLLCRLAPHAVQALPCVMPTYREFGKSRLALGLGLALYRALVAPAGRTAEFDGGERLISRAELQRLFPVPLDDVAITGGALWHDAQVYSAERLVIEFLLSARSRGAHIVNYARAERVAAATDQGVVVHVTDRLSARDFEVTGAAVLFADGAYGRDRRGGDAPRYARAVNLILTHTWGRYALGIAVPVASGQSPKATRLLFIVPWRGHALAGTWYFPDRPELGDRITQAELATCVADVRRLLGEAAAASIAGVHVGRLPLAARAAPGSLRLRERFAVCPVSDDDADCVYRIVSTKYTTARQAAQCAVTRILRDQGRAAAPANGNPRRLEGGDMNSFAAYVAALRTSAGAWLTPVGVQRLVRNYGRRAEAVLRYAEDRAELCAPIPGAADTLKAEIAYILDHELAYHVDDVLFRRTDLGTLHRPHADTIAYCLEQMGQRYAWDAQEKQRQMGLIDAYFDRVVA